jgi:hypothetical protein
MTKTIDEILFGGYVIDFLFSLDKDKKEKYKTGKYGLMHDVCIALNVLRHFCACLTFF